jgi:hypothetical protein
MTHPSERTGWREALKVIASGWAVAFIGVFIAFVGAIRPGFDDAFAVDVFISFVGAITGMGWLIYRSREKRKP